MGIKFGWDAAKARLNLTKHSVSFEEASTVFGDRSAITIPDPVHSLAEERFITIGISDMGKILVVVATQRGDSLRLISARSASRRERKQYEEAD